MLILKINEVFLPSAISPKGAMYDNMNSPYIGYCAEVIKELDWDNKPVENSRYVGVDFTIIEKSTVEAAIFSRGNIVAASNHCLLQGLMGLSWEEWLSDQRVLINNCDKPVLKYLEKSIREELQNADN